MVHNNTWLCPVADVEDVLERRAHELHHTHGELPIVGVEVPRWQHRPVREKQGSGIWGGLAKADEGKSPQSSTRYRSCGHFTWIGSTDTVRSHTRFKARLPNPRITACLDLYGGARCTHVRTCSIRVCTRTCLRVPFPS